MEHPFLSLFQRLMATKTPREAMAYMLKHPVLTSPHYTALLESWARTRPSPERFDIERMIKFKLNTFEQIRTGKVRVDLQNPITDLASEVIKGSFTLQHAMHIAARPEMFVELMYPAVTSLCDIAEEIMIKEWRIAVTLMRILFSALDARRGRIVENQQAMELTGIETWLAVACRACTDVPDGRIFHEVVRRAEAVADLVTDSDPPAPILHRLGVLHIDPFVGGRASGDIEQQLRRWQMRLSEEFGLELAGVPPAELNLPHIDEALPRAEQYFRRAAARRTGVSRGQTLKALVQTFHWQQIRNLPIDSADCIKLACEALTLLPQATFPGEQAEIRRIIDQFEKGRNSVASAAVKAGRAVLGTPVDRWVHQKGLVPTIDIYYMNAQAVADSDPALALQLWMAVDELVRSRPESIRFQHDSTLIRFVVRALGPEVPKADGSPTRVKLAEIRKLAERQNWKASKIAHILLSFAASTTASSQEGEGLQIMRDSMRVFDAVKDDPVVARCLPFLRAALQTGDAVNAYEAGKFGAAADAYADALGCHLEARQPLAALDILRRLIDLSKPGKPEQAPAIEALVKCLYNQALVLELEVGEAATDLIQSACRSAISSLMSSRNVKATTLLCFIDVAKGRRFRASVESTLGARSWLNAPRGIAVERDLRSLNKQAALEGSEKEIIFDRNLFLTSYVSADEKFGGATAKEQLRNLQIQFDTALDRQLSDPQKDDVWLPTIEKIQSLLAKTDILLLQYIGKYETGSLAINTLLISNRDCIGGQTITQGVDGDSAIKVSDAGVTTKSNWLSFPIAKLRDLIISPPGPRAADTRALEILDDNLTRYLGPELKLALEKFRIAGKTHLCVAPHGPFHFYPFHLLGPEDRPLANDWLVTYVPHISLLARPKSAGGHKIELTSVGINFESGNSLGLSELTNSEEEAGVIVTAYGQGAQLLPGRLATKTAVFESFTRSRRIHIATHGRHNVNAPFFQNIVLDAGPPDDRIIYAYELLRLDLRGLNLVTLSACETALGRIDVADNLRGIPAALLIAGVSTIVGTLWNVEADTAAHFFSNFYRALKENGSSKGAAFYEAQTKTRGKFPKYRDWAAFQLIGSWS